MAFNISGAPAGGNFHGHRGSKAGELHSWQRLNALREFGLERLRARLVVSHLVRIDQNGQHVVRIKTQEHIFSAIEATNEESCNNQQRQRACQLGHH